MKVHSSTPYVLVVEDNPSDAKLMRAALEFEGYVVQTARDGEEALHLLCTTHPRGMVIDLMLPGMNGLLLAARIKGDPRTSEIPLVAATAYDGVGTEKMARAAGYVGFYRKPIDVLSFPHQFSRSINPGEQS